MRLLLPLLLGLCTALCAAQALDIANAPFEADEDADGVPDGWRLQGASAATSVAPDEEGARDGKRSVRLTGDDAAPRMFLEGPRLPVKSETAYLFQARVKSEGVGAGFPNVGIGQWKADTSWDAWSQPLRAPTNRDWRLCRRVFTLRQTTAQVAARVWVESFRGTAWFDGVRVSEYAAEPLATVSVDDAASWEVDGEPSRAQTLPDDGVPAWRALAGPWGQVLECGPTRVAAL